ncbi:MAG TPA: RNA helicase, partial [Paenalcaligenes hominis]|nr:RNA helicase [Paenalcaligenes hominis]
EADRMLDMGFIRDIRRILKLVPEQRQSLLFSATFSDEIRALAKSSLRDPVEISVTPRNTASELITQEMVQTEQRHKRDLVSHIIRQSGWHQVLVFCRTKHGANRLADKLSKDGLSAAALHGNKSQAARTRALAGFKNGKVAVLVATDIAARGLDIDQLPYVINFELPQVAEDYVHRIGRTGRAGSEGRAISLVDTSETRLLKAIERLIKRPITPITIEGFTPSSEPEPVAPSHPAADATRSRNRRPNTAGTSSRSKSRSGNRSAPKRSSSTAPRNLQPIE